MNDHITVEYAVEEWGHGPWWVAHDHPERPPDDWTLWSWPCDACVLHLVAAAGTQGDRMIENYDTTAVDGEKMETTLRDTLTEVRAWRAANDHRPI